MTRKRSKKKNNTVERLSQNSSHKENQPIESRSTSKHDEHVDDNLDNEILAGLKSVLDDENKPGTSKQSCSSTNNTAALYDELDTFRLKWKRELGNSKNSTDVGDSNCKSSIIDTEDTRKTNKITENSKAETEESSQDDQHNNCDDIYQKAKKLFLTAVELEQDDMHHESIRYYKQAMHLCPDIEKLIFKEQCEASAKIGGILRDKTNQNNESHQATTINDEEEKKIELFTRISDNFHEDICKNGYVHCWPKYTPKAGTLHLAQLPKELILLIYRYVIGEELDLGSLESLGLVCRGFYLLSKDVDLWRSICYTTWGSETLKGNKWTEQSDGCPWKLNQIEWRKMFLERPRLNFDGVYISRTKYIRQGDVGFQDLTYRPFHVVLYYRYLRFFPDGRVLILVTNEEPDKIVPIFRHALHSKQFSPILDGTFEFVSPNQVVIVAEKDCRARLSNQTQNQRRQAQFYWSRQTPISQKFNLKFELKTVESKPHRNNALKWIDYSILTKLETGQETTTFDITSDTFPNFYFYRVRKFNLKLTNPLASH